nr:CapA family protein [Nocardioides thalensis]
MTIVGDLMLVRGVADGRRALAPMAGLLRSADLTVGNLEQTLSTDGEPTQGGDSFGGSPADLDLLRWAGFDAVSLANNHLGDYGERALLETVDLLSDGPVRAFGAGRTARAAARPLLLEARGTTFAFLGFNAIGETPMATATTPGALSVRMPPRTGPLQQADLDRVTAAVRRADRVADAVVVLPHWGTQYTHVPEPVQHRVARALVAAGADLVVGGHPHWVQGVEQISGVPVLHSLGNFVFDMDWEPQVMQGVMLETTWRGPELISLRLVPYAMDPATFAPRVVDGEVAADILRDVASTTSPSAGPLVRCLTSSPSRRVCTP